MRLLLLVPLLVLACGEEPVQPPAPSATVCGIANPVYHPARLRSISPCRVYRGVVIAKIYEEHDGDWHLWVEPDTAQDDLLLNTKNVYQGRKALVLEIVPACTSEPADAAEAKRCPTSRLGVPNVGFHIEVSGPLVLDLEHGWDEIHPVVTLRILPRIADQKIYLPEVRPSN